MMKKISDCALCRSFRQKCRELSRYRLRKKYDVSFWIYADEQTENAECAHRFTGDSRHQLWKIAVFLGALTLFCSLIRSVVGLFKKC